jgi:hypothetical protein
MDLENTFLDVCEDEKKFVFIFCPQRSRFWSWGNRVFWNSFFDVQFNLLTECVLLSTKKCCYKIGWIFANNCLLICFGYFWASFDNAYCRILSKFRTIRNAVMTKNKIKLLRSLSYFFNIFVSLFVSLFVFIVAFSVTFIYFSKLCQTKRCILRPKNFLFSSELIIPTNI